jgi:proline iminopeptidase
MYATLRDTRIFFDVDGVGLVPTPSGMIARPTAMLIHGGPGADHSNMKSTHRPLAADMQLVFFDQRGHGRSAPAPIERCTMDEAVEDLEALRLYLGLGPIVSIGGSYGGMVAMAHAARYPASVSALVLSATAAHHGLLDRAHEIVGRIGTSAQVAALRRMTDGALDDDAGVGDYFRVMAPLYSRALADRGSGSAAGGAIMNHDIARRAFGPGGFMQRFDLRGELHRITAPTLILAGRHDFVCAPEFAEELHDLIESSQLVIFENSAHLIGLDEPERYIAAIAEFVSAQEGRQRD